MLDKIVLAVITGLIIASLSSWITVRLSLSKFKKEKRWERQVVGYERVLDALHAIKKNNREWDNAFRIDRHTPPTEKLEALDAKREEAMDFLERAIDLGELILPKDVIGDIRMMLAELRSLDINEENYMEAYSLENEVIEKALGKIRSKAL